MTSYKKGRKKGNAVTITFTMTSRRYIRLSFTANTDAPGSQVAEFEIYQ